ncbi:MAG: sigma-54-dependent Fis family transcriptional regulator [Candidatus Rokubacteria bacterium]|nr:sigma-54-dependent Fis family transcriptional regulator [Candidatus Rokubacteria bacterium]
MKRPRARVLVVDDEPDMARNVGMILVNAGLEAIVETESLRALELLERERPDLVVADLRMPDLDGLALLQRARRLHAGLPVVMLTAYASVDSAVEAMKKGASDYLAKPFAPEELVLRVEKALAWVELAEENRYLRERVASGERGARLVGESPALAEVMRLVDKVAATDAKVLLVGESGTGKELIARTIHQRGPHPEAPFFAINCGALTESLLESELFGHERGAFTGAVATKRGIFEMASGGTLLLDEIGETSLAFQTKLLRAVQEAEFFRVGGTRPLRVQARLVSSSNRDLRKAVAEGRFREDLFYRLSVVTVTVPPLRERGEDIPLLASHFLRVYATQIKKKVHGIHPDAMALLARYRWPGNVRELENVIERAVIMVEGDDQILPEDLPGDLVSEPVVPAGPMDGVREAERDVILRALRECNWNRSLAAKRLGIGRRTLYDKLTRLGILLHPS